jgi:RimJ/RimL family protein N-acetyltransferase
MISSMGEERFNNEQLMTPRLSLDRPTPAVIPDVYRIHRDPVACAHNPSDRLATRGEAEDRYHAWDAHWQRHGFGYWVVRRLGDGPDHGPDHAPQLAPDDLPGAAVGFCGLKLMRLHGRDVLNLFYRLDPPVWGDGLATEAATAVVAWARTHLPGYPVIARVRPDNVASGRVASRAGLQRAQWLDTRGEDGLDWIFVAGWEDDCESTTPRHG